jgi:hypothetical protein
MICLIASSFPKADKWARAQNLKSTEWFYLSDENDLLSRTHFHVIVVDTDFDKYQQKWFERIYPIAKERGGRPL